MDGSRSAWTCVGPRRRPHDAHLQDVERPPAAEAGLGRSSSRAAAAELVGVHGHLDAARATLSSRVASRADPPRPQLRPRRSGTGSDLRLLRDQSGTRLGRGGRALRESRATISGGCCTTRASRLGRYDPQEQFSLLELGYGLTNAAYRTTPGRATCGAATSTVSRSSGVSASTPREPSRSSARRRTAASIAERPELGPQERSIGSSALYRASVDVARERRRPVRRPAEVVPTSSPTGSSPTSDRRCAGSCSTPSGACCSSASSIR